MADEISCGIRGLPTKSVGDPRISVACIEVLATYVGAGFKPAPTEIASSPLPQLDSREWLANFQPRQCSRD